MNFSSLPPEINSALMYSGPGAGPMADAAMAWDGLAAQLQSTAAAYSTTISTLAGQHWLGMTSGLMVSAVSPYVQWMQTTAAQVEHTAAQLKAAAIAYAAAFATTVPPAVVAANRSTLLSLVATNLLGQNTAAIAATETAYGEMWAQDAAAMDGYASSSAAASTLQPFTPPPGGANPAAGASAADRTPLQALGILDVMQGATAVGAIGNFTVQSGILSRQYNMDAKSGGTPPPIAVPGPGTGTLVSGAGAGAVRSPALVSAGAGRASSIGGLSVPQSWAAPPQVRQLVRTLPFAGSAAVPAGAVDAVESPYAGLGLASMAGGGMGGLAGLGASGACAPASAQLSPGAAASASAKPAASTVAKPAVAGAVTLPTDNIAANLAATLAAMPGATVVVIPAPPTSA